MVTLLFYLYLFVFWLENVLGLKLTNVKGLSFSNTVIYIFIVIWALQFIRNKRLFSPHPASAFLIFFLGSVIFSTTLMVLIGEVPHVTLTRAIISIKSWANPIILFFIFYNIIPDEKACYNFITALILFLIVTVLTMLLGTFGYLDYGWLLFGATARASGFGNPNDYASYLVLFTPLFLAKFFLINTNMVWRPIGVIALLFISLGFIITGSRGGMLGVLFAVFVFVVLIRYEVKLHIPLVIVMIAGSCLLLSLSFFVAPQQIREDVQERVVPERGQGLDKYSAGRLSNWNNTFKLFLKRPIVGHGHKSLKSQVRRYFHSKKVGHNLYLAYLAQYGLVGFILFVTALIKILHYVKYSYSLSRNMMNKFFYISYLAGVAGYFFSLMFLVGSTSHYFFWIYTAVISKLSYLELLGSNSKKIDLGYARMK